MRIYKFLSKEFALKSLRERRLKISLLSQLNDPFEMLPFDGKIEFVKYGNGLVRLKRSVLDGFVASCTIRAKKPNGHSNKARLLARPGVESNDETLAR